MSKEVTAYIDAFPEDTRALLVKFRQTVSKAAPDATEVINYGIPTLQLEGNLVHFGGYAKHIGFYPAPSAIRAFSAELQGFKTAKGSIQFPLDKKIPWGLVTRMVKFRVKENLARRKKQATS